MIPDGYRVNITYDNDKQKFVASVPELTGLRVEAETRTDAFALVEEAIETRFREAAESKKEMPTPLDSSEFSGDLQTSISESLHRELHHLALAEGVEFNQLLSEMLSAGVARRTQGPARRDNSRQERSSSRRRNPRQKQDYNNIMDDRANFIEYVRNMDGGGRGGNRSGGGGNRSGSGSGGGGAGGGGRGRSRSRKK
ncbi:MAG: type II toxin-antitoxin system HicB family antitoxin [Deltaproteobacteria bacterium]|nr:type II toxin-antitoxin system HicB family antitoxin [Deltaproteobacteria bacterium]